MLGERKKMIVLVYSIPLSFIYIYIYIIERYRHVLYMSFSSRRIDLIVSGGN